MYLNFKTGLAKYSGLLEMAVGHKIINQNGATYSLADGTKLGYYKNWCTNSELWETKILPSLEEALNKSLQFSREEYEITQHANESN